MASNMHVFVAHLYHPSTNGLVERFVQTFETAIRAGESEGRAMHHLLANFLLTYRVHRMPLPIWHHVIFILKRHVHMQCDLLRTGRNRELTSKQAMDKKGHILHSVPHVELLHSISYRMQEFCMWNRVLAKNFLDGASGYQV